MFANGVFKPVGRFGPVAAEHFGEGEIISVIAQEDRSEVSHRQQFAWLRDAFHTMPESLRETYVTVEHLRKRGLIATGHCTTQDYVCASQAEAARWAANLRREVDEHAVITVSAGVVRVFRAKSQARGAMDKTEFQQAKQDLMDWVAGILGVEPDQLGKAA
jgi:hypothetical protein